MEMFILCLSDPKGVKARKHPARFYAALSLGMVLHIVAHSRRSHTFPRMDLEKTFIAYRRIWTNRSVQSAHRHGHTRRFHSQTSDTELLRRIITYS